MEAAATSAARSPKLLLGLPLAALAILIGSLLGFAVVLGGTPGCTGGGEAVGGLGRGVPQRLAPIYMGAAQRYHLGARGPSVLAAINFVETDFGKNVATSSAGAEGWMAFLPSTFAAWGVDGNGDGVKDIFNAADAVYSAANYLHDSGAPGDWQEAVFAYNHADWYVEKVLRYARRFASGVVESQGSSCSAAATAPNEAVARMLAAAKVEAERKLGYVWGGADPETGFDCSGGVSWILDIGGFFSGRTNTSGLAAWGEPGPGRWITVYVKTSGDAEEEHAAIAIDGVLYESGGGGENENPAGGWGRVDPGQAAAFLSQFDTERHPRGF
jgi:hypothetical protein